MGEIGGKLPGVSLRPVAGPPNQVLGEPATLGPDAALIQDRLHLILVGVLRGGGVLGRR